MCGCAEKLDLYQYVCIFDKLNLDHIYSCHYNPVPNMSPSTTACLISIVDDSKNMSYHNTFFKPSLPILKLWNIH